MSTPSPTHSVQNSVRSRRMARDWSQQELADLAGLSRAGISAIEAGRLAPSVTAAMALGRALCCTVEDLFAPPPDQRHSIEWAVQPTNAQPRYWNASVGGRNLSYPVEDDSPQLEWHDGVVRGNASPDLDSDSSRRTLVVACCDPAAGLLAAEYARQHPFRMIVLRRSSREALALLAAGKVHVAGLHLGRTGNKSQNLQTTRSSLGDGFSLLRVARWEEGLAVSARFKMPTLHGILRSKARWVGREEGSGARQCQDEILRDRPAPRRVAFDHRSVAAAVRCGWADIGPCVRLASEESGLRFLKVAEKDYDLCFSGATVSEPRISALLATIRSHSYRSRLSELPGYSTKHTGELLEAS